MAEYLVRARPKEERMEELEDLLNGRTIDEMKPFGRSMAESLRSARVVEGGGSVWEETCYCSPPLKMERAQVLDRFFEGIETETVEAGEGWKRIDSLPRLFPSIEANP